MRVFSLKSITTLARWGPASFVVLLSWLALAVLATANDAPSWLIDVLRLLVVPAYASWLGLFLLTKGLLGSLTWPLALLGTVIIALAIDRYLRSWADHRAV